MKLRLTFLEFKERFGQFIQSIQGNQIDLEHLHEKAQAVFDDYKKIENDLTKDDFEIYELNENDDWPDDDKQLKKMNWKDLYESKK